MAAGGKQQRLLLLLLTFTFGFCGWTGAQPSPLCEGPFLEQKNLIACNSNKIVVFTLDDGSGGTPLNVTLHSSQDFTPISSSYNSTTGAFQIELDGSVGNFISSAKEYGTFYLAVTTSSGLCYLKGHIVECCNESVAGAVDIVAVDEPLNNYLSPGTSSNLSLVLMGDISLDAGNYTLEDSELWLGPDAQILPDDQVGLDFENSDLDAFCDCRWDRLFTDGIDQEIGFNSSEMRGALRGIMADGEMPIELVNSDFIDNLIAVNLLNFSGSGPFNGSYLKVDNCTFDFLNDPGTVYCVSNSAVNLSREVCDANRNTPLVHLMAENCDNLHVGHENYGQNRFISTWINLDATYLNVDNSQVFVRNNAMEAQTNICSFNDSRLYVGGSAAQGNRFAGDLITLTESSVIFDHNQVTSVNFTFDDPTYQLVATGAPVTGSQFKDNTFENGFFVFNGNNNNSYLRLVENEFKYLSKMELISLGFSATRRIVFHSNRVLAKSSAAAMDIRNCNHLVFANNEVDNDVFYTPDGGTDYHGIDLRNTRDAEFTGNIFKNFNRGIELRSNLTNTQFSCNDFINNYHAFYLVNSPTLSDQGSASEAADNYFLYFYSGSTFPYGDNIAGSSPAMAIDWFISPPSSCTGTPQPNTVNPECIYELVPGLDPTPNATAPICSLPPNMKRVIYEEKYSENLYYKALVKWQLYPNPAQEKLTIERPDNEEKAPLLIVNHLGQIVLRKELKERKFVIDISSLKPGLYHLQAGDFQTTWLKQ